MKEHQETREVREQQEATETPEVGTLRIEDVLGSGVFKEVFKVVLGLIQLFLENRAHKNMDSQDIPPGADTAETTDPALQEQLEKNAMDRMRYERAALEHIAQVLRENHFTIENWQAASEQQRSEVLVNILNTMAKTFQIPIGEYGYFQSKDTHGFFRMGENGAIIALNDELLRSPSPIEALNTLAHEFYHAYQWYYVAEAERSQYNPFTGLDTTTAENWKKSQQEYSVRAHHYINNVLEKDANLFSQQLVQAVFL